jgi:peptide/nickel transport system substrate-binding protein
MEGNMNVQWAVRLASRAIIALTFILASFSAHAQDNPKHGGSIVYAMEAEIPWMDPHIAFGGTNKRVVTLVYEGLVVRDRTNPAPGKSPPLVGQLATSWSISPDGLVYTFKLREGIKFHDGTPFNADAVVFNFRRIIDPSFEFYFERAKPLRTTPLRYLKEVRKVDDSTVELVLSQPWGLFLNQLATTLSSGLPLFISPEAVKKYGNQDVNLHPSGTGPFKITGYEAGVKTTLERNAEYWNQPLPYLDKITFVVMPEATTRVTALEAGEVDVIAALLPDAVPPLEEKGFNIVASEVTNQIWYYGVNLDEQSGALKDKRVRQALNYAVDRVGMADQLLLKQLYPLDGMIVATSPLWKRGLPERYPYDPEKAKALLKEAGFAEGLHLKALIPTTGSSMMIPVPMTEWFQRDLEAVGIKLDIQTTDWTTYLGYWVKGMASDVAFDCMSWASDHSEDWALDIFGSKGFGNTGHIKDEVIDKLFTEYELTADPQKQLDLMRQAFDRIREEAYMVPIGSDKNIIVANKRIKGNYPIPDWMQIPQYWWVED